MVATLDKAQEYKTEALNLYNQAQAKMDEYEGKEMPSDVFAEVNRIFAAGDQKSKLAELTQKGAEAQKWKELPNDLKKLETPQGQLIPEKGNEVEWEKVMQKYGLKRWEIQGTKTSIQNFNKAFDGSRKLLLQDRGIDTKALQGYGEGTATGFTGGGYLTPDIFVAEFVNKLYLASHLRQAGARVVPLISDITRYPKMTTASAAATLVSESSAVTATQATVGEQAFQAWMFRALQQASIELVADAEFDVLSTVIMPDLAQMFAAAENSYFTVGTGTTQPNGIITDVSGDSANTSISVGSAAFAAALSTLLTFDIFINTMHKLKPQYRTAPGVGWMMNDTLIALVRQIKAVSAGTYIWEPSQQVGQPDTIYGRPVYYNQTMTGAGATASTYPILYGAFSYFWIGDRMGLDVRTANELYLANAQIGYFAFKRFDSHVMQTEAFAIVKAT